jgi:hypothetical protein
VNERPLPASERSPADARSRAIAHWLDDAFRIPGTRIRFGLDPVIGLIPGLGDVVGGLLSTYIVVEAVRANAPRALLIRMLANLGIDMVLAAIPFVGDLFDAGWKANSRNLSLLRRHIEQPEEAHVASRAFAALLIVGVLLVAAGTAFVSFLTLRWLLEALGGS